MLLSNTIYWIYLNVEYLKMFIHICTFQVNVIIRSALFYTLTHLQKSKTVRGMIEGSVDMVCFFISIPNIYTFISFY